MKSVRGDGVAAVPTFSISEIGKMKNGLDCLFVGSVFLVDSFSLMDYTVL